MKRVPVAYLAYGFCGLHPPAITERVVWPCGRGHALDGRHPALTQLNTGRRTTDTQTRSKSNGRHPFCSTQKLPKLLPPGAFSEIKIYENAFAAGA